MLPFRSAHTRNGALPAFVAVLILSCAAFAASPSPSPRKSDDKETKPGALTRIPLPIGQEAKGLVLPDFDTDGRLRARFEAGTAKRLDTENVEFKSLKMTTFTEQNTPDLLIEMPLSTLNLETQVIASRERTTVSRTDFTISGDAMSFDTVGRKGTLVGNVKMVITGQTQATANPGQ
jgi:hypothetical protein